MKYVWTFILFIVSFLPIFANEHRIGFQASTAYSDLLGGSFVEKHGGFAVDAGCVYEWQHKHLLFQIGANMEYSYTSITNKQYLGSFPNMIDTDKDICNYHFSMDRKRDQMNFINVAPHIAVGGWWNVLYFLAGLRGDLNLFKSVASNGFLTTAGEYANLIIPLQFMNNHYFVDSYPLAYHNNKFENGYKGCLSVMGELGVEIPTYHYERISSTHTIQRLALYVEYGFLTFGKQVDTPLIDFHLQSNNLSDIDFEKISIQPLYFSNMQSLNALHKISIGVRWTILFEFPHRQGCKCYGY
jgi:hypothetical protein